MNRLWVLIQAYLDREDVTVSWLARRIGEDKATVDAWKNRGTKPGSSEKLRRLAGQTGYPYDVLNMAREVDKKWATDDELLVVLRKHKVDESVIEQIRQHVGHQGDADIPDGQVNGE